MIDQLLCVHFRSIAMSDVSVSRVGSAIGCFKFCTTYFSLNNYMTYVGGLSPSSQGSVAGTRRRGLSDGLTLTRWRNAFFG